MTQSTPLTGHQAALLGLRGDGSAYADDTSDVPVRDVVEAACSFALAYSRAMSELLDLAGEVESLTHDVAMWQRLSVGYQDRLKAVTVERNHLIDRAIERNG